MKSLKIIKIGGNVIDNPEMLNQFLRDFGQIEGYKILVHGGGKKASKVLSAMGIEPKMVGGRRITDENTLEVVTMVYAGLINKQIVANLQEFKCNAIGLSGADGNTILATKRPVRDIDYGYAGDLSANSVNPDLIESLLQSGLIPVFCAITHNGAGQLLNTNADTIANELAKSLKSYFETTLIYCFEKNGVLLNPDDDNSIIPEINFSDFQQYKSQKIITDGMIPKMENAFEAIEGGVKEVIVKHARNINKNFGTRLY